MKPSRHYAFWTSGLAAVLICAAAGAAEESGAALDRQLQGLKGETLVLQRDLLALDRAARFPDGSRTAFFVSVNVTGFLLDRVTLRIDDQDAAAYGYSGTEARAFWKSGWHLLQDVRLEPGTHRLQAGFEGHFWNAPEGTPAVTGKLESEFTKEAAPLDLALPVTRAGLHDKPVLSPLQKITSPTAGDDNDPRYRSALFLKNDTRFLSALTELLAMGGDASQLPPSSQLLMAASYTGFGMEDAAQQLDRRLAAGSADPLVAGRARLDLARLEYDRGYLDAAAQTLQEMRAGVPEKLREEWRTSLAETLLALGRYRDTVSLLSGDAGSTAAVALTPGQRYNLAVALIKDGRATEGRLQLNQVGTLETKDGDTLALRDKANLILGYQYLQSQSGDDARVAFHRVRTQGPFSNQALLGLGWAEVAPVTGGTKSELVESGARGADSLAGMPQAGADAKGAPKVAAGSAAPVDEQKAVQRALVPWVELIKRDPMDPAVQEGFLAIAWSLERLHSDEQSIAYYEHATEALELGRKRMKQARKAIQNGQMVYTMIQGDLDSERGWKWHLVNLADTPETYFLQRLLAQHRFQEVLKDYRDALFLDRTLAAAKVRLAALEQLSVPPAAVAAAQLADASAPAAGVVASPPAPMASPEAQAKLKSLRAQIDALTPRVAANSAAQKHLLETVALQELDGQQQQIERYLTESRSAVARLYERQLKDSP